MIIAAVIVLVGGITAFAVVKNNNGENTPVSAAVDNKSTQADNSNTGNNNSNNSNKDTSNGNKASQKDNMAIITVDNGASKAVGVDESGYIYKKPKTKSSIRTVDILDFLIPIIKQYRAEYVKMRWKLGTAWQGESTLGGNLFVGLDGKRLSGRCCILVSEKTY